MASRTQIRLQQITGSFGNATGKIRDDIAASEGATLDGILATDLTGSLGIIASSIKRIVGGAGANAFSAVAASTLKDVGNTDRITYADSAATILRGPAGTADLTVADALVTVADDLTISGGDVVLGDAGNADNTTIAAANESGTDTAGKSLTISAGASTGNAAGGSLIFQTSTSGGGSGASVNSKTTALTIDGTNLATFAGNIKIPDSGQIGSATSADAIVIANDGIVTFKDDILIKDTGTIGNASVADVMTLAADGVVTFKDDILIKNGGTIGSATTANAITIASDGDVTILKDLIVSGDTFTVNVENMTVEDGIIGLATTGSTAYGPLNNDRGIVFGGGDFHTKQPVFYYDGSADKFVIATTTTSPASASFPATPGQAELDTLILSEVALAFDGNEAITGDGDNITLTAGTDVIFDQTGAVVINGTKQLEFGGADSGEFIKHGGSNILELVAGADIKLNPTGDVVIAGSSKLEFNVAGSGEHISGDGNDLMIESGQDVIINATRNIDLDTGASNHLRFFANATELGSILKGAGNALMLSSSNTAGLALFANDGIITLGDDRHDVAGNTILDINLNTQNKATFQVGTTTLGAIDRLSLLHNVAGTSVLHELSGSLVLDNGFDAAEVRLNEKTPNGSNFVGLKSADSIGTSYSIVLPDGSASATGKFLRVASRASDLTTLEFGDAGDSISKGVYILTGSHAVGVNFRTDTNAQRSSVSDSISGLATTDTQGKTLDVYVNGQLLTSGSDELVVAGQRDYLIENSSHIAFAFALEDDDIIQIIKR